MARYEVAAVLPCIVDNNAHDLWPYGTAAARMYPHRAEYTAEDAQAVCDMLNSREDGKTES